jgi:hypothetical protein
MLRFDENRRGPGGDLRPAAQDLRLSHRREHPRRRAISDSGAALLIENDRAGKVKKDYCGFRIAEWKKALLSSIRIPQSEIN